MARGAPLRSLLREHDVPTEAARFKAGERVLAYHPRYKWLMARVESRTEAGTGDGLTQEFFTKVCSAAARCCPTSCGLEPTA